MEKALESLLINAPAAAAIIVVVIVFLRHMRDRDSLIHDLHQESEESRRASRKVIEENTLMAGRHLIIAQNVSEMMREVSQTLRGCQVQREILEQKINHKKDV